MYRRTNANIGYWAERLESGKRYRQPRTNCEGAEFWAAHILLNGGAGYTSVNSIIIDRDTVYSFGSHFPMGKIIRNANGRCVKVVLNTDWYPHRGWASTPNDQANVRMCALDAIGLADWHIELVEVPLSSYNIGNGIPVRTTDDPEPAEYWTTEVPPLFFRTHPGPEPVQDRSNCLAGRVEEYQYQTDSIQWADHELLAQDQAYTVQHHEAPRPGDFLIANERSTYARVRRMHVGYIVWADADQDWQYKRDHPEHAGDNYFIKQCPCCRAHRNAHRAWHERMFGPAWGRGRGKGYAQMSEQIERYGSVDAWREARRADLARVRAGRKARAAWVSRNFIPLHAVSRDKHGVPILRDGYALNKDRDAYFKSERARVREQRREAKIAIRHARERERVLRFHERMERARQRRRERSFEGTVQRVLVNLRELRTNNELESNDEV